MLGALAPTSKVVDMLVTSDHGIEISTDILSPRDAGRVSRSLSQSYSASHPRNHSRSDAQLLECAQIDDGRDSKGGYSGLERVKTWVARGRLASQEAKQADLGGSEHGER